MSTHKTALIIGASRGLGLAIAKEFLQRKWHVVGTVRQGKKSELQQIADKSEGALAVEFLDITEESEVLALKKRLAAKTFDIIFVNAGVTNNPAETVADVATDEFIRVMTTNALSPMRVVEHLTENIKSGGAIGVMTSGLGSVANNESGGYEIYRASKAALNTLMKSFAARRGQNLSMFLLAPGWIKTDMGGDSAPFTVAEVMPQIVDTIVAQEGKIGLRYIDRFGKVVNW